MRPDGLKAALEPVVPGEGPHEGVHDKAVTEKSAKSILRHRLGRWHRLVVRPQFAVLETEVGLGGTDRFRSMSGRPWLSGRMASELSVIDADGRVIVPFTGGRSASLPLVIGAGADKQAKLLLAQMAAFPQIAGEVKAYARVGDRRWDLVLKNGVTLMLPEYRIDEALADIADMDRKAGLLSRDIASVDMRLTDRVVVRLTPDAMVQRVEYLKARDKAPKRSEKRV